MTAIEAREGSARPGKPSILVVDDCRTVRDRIREILEAEDYSVREAPDGARGLQELHRARPDMVLVDFVMPEMNGYQFCQAIRAMDDLRTVPVILVSVKADRIGEQFIRLGLADDALSKPFQPAALRAVVAHGLQRPSPRAGADSEGPDEAAQPQPASLAADPDEHARQCAASAVERFREGVVGGLVPALERALTLDARALDAVRRAVDEAFSESVLRGLLPALSGLDPHAGVPSFSGTLDALPIGEVFQMISMQGLTGTMEIERPGFLARIFLSKGRIDLSRLDGEGHAYRLGRYLVQDDLVSAREIERLAGARDESAAPIGERLIRLGLIAREDLQAALRRQAADIFYEVLRWTHGLFRFRPNIRVDEAARAALAIPISELLMEGYRRIDEWRLIEREIRDFAEVFQQDPVAIGEMDAGALSTEEKLVLDAVLGSHSVADVIGSTRLDTFEACRILYRLLSMKLIRRVRGPADSS